MRHTAHRFLPASVLALAMVLLTLTPGTAGSSAAVTPISSLTLAKASEEFQAFSAAWIANVNKQHIKGITRMEVVKLSDGQWLARYHAVDPASVKREVKKTTHPKTPFVGTLKYTEQILENTGKDIKAAKGGQFKAIKGIKVTEIFCRTPKGWQ